MTRKSTLSAWASRLGANLPASATVSQLEQGIDDAIASLATTDKTGVTLAQGLRNNWQIIHQELPSAAKAVVANLLG